MRAFYIMALVLGMRLLPLAAAGQTTSSAPVERDGAGPVRITIHAADRLQRIDGFGASTFGGFELLERGGCDQVVPVGTTYHTTAEQRSAMIHTLVRELGLSHVRVWLWRGVEPRNDNDDPAVMDWAAFDFRGSRGKPAVDDENVNRDNGLDEWADFLKPAVAAGLVNWIVTPGELPAWLNKRLKDVNDEKRFEEYAEWAAATLLYLKRMGLEAPYWSMFNEPDTRGWTAAAFWKSWIRATGRRFRKEGIRTRIMFPDFMDVHRAVALVPEVMADAEVRSYIVALAYHHYRSSGDGPQPFLKLAADLSHVDDGERYERLTKGARSMAQFARQYGIPSWQTETAYYPKNVADLSEWEIGRGRANEIYYELASGCSAVQAMMAFWVDAIDSRYQATVRHEGHYVVMKTDGRNVRNWDVTRDAGAVLGHYGRFVHPGDFRIRVDCREPALRTTGFIAHGRDRVVLVIVNNAPLAIRVCIAAEGAPANLTFSQVLVTDESRLLSLAELHGPLETGCHEVSIPPLSLSTLVWAERPLPAGPGEKDLGREERGGR